MNGNGRHGAGVNGKNCAHLNLLKTKLELFVARSLKLAAASIQMSKISLDESISSMEFQMFASLPLTALRAFESASRLLSFKAAAEEFP